ncbi:hypothetical protein ScPMuIL_013892 [Solemya velum]
MLRRKIELAFETDKANMKSRTNHREEQKTDTRVISHYCDNMPELNLTDTESDDDFRCLPLDGLGSPGNSNRDDNFPKLSLLDRVSNGDHHILENDFAICRRGKVPQLLPSHTSRTRHEDSDEELFLHSICVSDKKRPSHSGKRKQSRKRRNIFQEVSDNSDEELSTLPFRKKKRLSASFRSEIQSPTYPKIQSELLLFKYTDEETVKPRTDTRNHIHPGLKDITTTGSDFEAIDQLHLFVDQGSLIGDGSRMHCLPTTRGRHQDLISVSIDTVSDVVKGKYDGLSQYTIIDCRYPYEYNGGHIEGARNLYTENSIREYLQQRQEDCDSGVNSFLIFHCEFSCERGPKLCRFLRNEDRKRNKENYPALLYPEIYLMTGGYKAFFATHSELCCPIEYVPMVHPEYAEEFRHFRSKSTFGSMFERKRRSQHSLRF